MVGKIVNHLNSINNFSKKIIVFTSIISFVLCACGVGVILYDASIGSTITLHTIGSTFIYTAIVLFAQFVVGSLVIDFFKAVIDSD